MCDSRDYFSKLSVSNGSLKVGNEQYVPVEGIGTINLDSTVNGREKHFHYKMHCIQRILMYTLISSSQARRNGFRQEIDDEDVNLIKGILRIIQESQIQ